MTLRCCAIRGIMVRCLLKMSEIDVIETIRRIKSDLRASMNGAASEYMRRSGLEYKLNYGVELPRIREIAKEYPEDHALAQALWKENARECKIMAAMLQPIGQFCSELADVWMESMPNEETAQHTVQLLFSRLPYASEKAFEWIASEREMAQVCGYLMLARLFLNGKELNERSENEFLDQASAALSCGGSVRRSAIRALQSYMNLNKEAEERAEALLCKRE